MDGRDYEIASKDLADFKKKFLFEDLKYLFMMYLLL